MSVCSVDKCETKVYARGWCRKHYRHVVEGGRSEPHPVAKTHCDCGQKLKEIAGTRNLCKSCFYKDWKSKNLDQYKKYQEQYRNKNKEKIYRQSSEWRKKNRDRDNAYYAEKRKDPLYRLKHNLRSRLWQHLKGHIKHKSTMTLTGCEIDELKKHLENQFEPGMSWDNYGKAWVVDHIIPLCSIQPDNLDNLEKICHFSNLRPMWYNLNSSKAAEDKKWKRSLQKKNSNYCLKVSKSS